MENSKYTPMRSRKSLPNLTESTRSAYSKSTNTHPRSAASTRSTHPPESVSSAWPNSTQKSATASNHTGPPKPVRQSTARRHSLPQQGKRLENFVNKTQHTRAPLRACVNIRLFHRRHYSRTSERGGRRAFSNSDGVGNSAGGNNKKTSQSPPPTPVSLILSDPWAEENDQEREVTTEQENSATDIMNAHSEGSSHRRGPYIAGNLKLIDTIECSNDVMCCRFNENGSHLAVGLTDGAIKVYETDPYTFNCLYSLQDEDTSKRPLPVTQIRFRAYEMGEKVEYSHILIASYASGMVKFWHYTSGKCLHTIKEPSTTQILTLAINPQNTHFITSGDNPHIHQYDIHTFQLVNTFFPSDGKEIMDGHRCRVFAVQYHPTTDHTFISGGWDNTVQYWDDREKHSVKRISGPHICGDALDIDPKHDHILTGSWRKEKTLQIWDFPSGEWIKDVPQEPMNSSQIYCCQWLGTDSIICGGTDQNMARIIDRGTLNTTGQLVDLPQSVYCIDNNRHGHHPITAVGSNKYIFLVKEEKQSSS